MNEELRPLLPTPSGLASPSTHQPRFKIPATAATVGDHSECRECSARGLLGHAPRATPPRPQPRPRLAGAGKS